MQTGLVHGVCQGTPRTAIAAADRVRRCRVLYYFTSDMVCVRCQNCPLDAACTHGYTSTTTLQTSISPVALGFAGNEFNLPKTRKYRPDMGFVRFRNVVILGVIVKRCARDAHERDAPRVRRYRTNFRHKPTPSRDWHASDAVCSQTVDSQRVELTQLRGLSPILAPKSS
jgi:hypothetical protein